MQNNEPLISNLAPHLTKRTTNILQFKFKYDTLYYDISTPELELKALHDVFRICDVNKYYSDLLVSNVKSVKKEVEECAKLSISKTPKILRVAAEKLKKDLKKMQDELVELESQRDLYLKAKKGDKQAAAQLVMSRRKYEYEEIESFQLTTVK